MSKKEPFAKLAKDVYETVKRTRKCSSKQEFVLRQHGYAIPLGTKMEESTYDLAFGSCAKHRFKKKGWMKRR